MVLAIGRLLPPYVGVGCGSPAPLAGVTIGERTVISGRLVTGRVADPARHLAIGDDCFINDGVRFDTAAPITIGDDVAIGHDVLVLTASHECRHPRARAPASSRPTRIEDGAWLEPARASCRA